MYILLCGTGVGFSVERQYITKLPEVAEDFHETDTVINVADRETIYGMKDNLIPFADTALNPTETEYPNEIFVSPAEVALFWFENDMLCKVKSDMLRYPMNQATDNKTIILVDYKTTQSVRPRDFISSVKKYQ